MNAAAMLPTKSGVTLEEFVKEWRTSVAVNLKASTTRTAESHLRAHIMPKLGSSAIERDKHKDRSKLRGISRKWRAFKKDG